MGLLWHCSPTHPRPVGLCLLAVGLLAVSLSAAIPSACAILMYTNLSFALVLYRDGLPALCWYTLTCPPRRCCIRVSTCCALGAVLFTLVVVMPLLKKKALREETQLQARIAQLEQARAAAAPEVHHQCSVAVLLKSFAPVQCCRVAVLLKSFARHHVSPPRTLPFCRPSALSTPVASSAPR